MSKKGEKDLQSAAQAAAREEEVTALPALPASTVDSSLPAAQPVEQVETVDPPRESLAKGIPWRIYTSHFFSTWNSRSFEFGAVLFLAHIYPDTLQPLSIYAMVRSAAAIIFSPSLGKSIDQRGRLAIVRVSIVAGRLAVVLSAFAFWALYTYDSLPHAANQAIFAVLIILACIEKLASIMNLVAVERDWVVVIAQGNEPVLQKLNARMRRVDLICKLAGPLFIALVDGASTVVAIWLTLGINVISLPLEYFLIARVYNIVPQLGIPKTSDAANQSEGTQDPRDVFYSTLRRLQGAYELVLGSFKFYFSHRACLPSFSLSLLYLTVLSFGGQMVTYLVAAGYTSFVIALVRTLSVLFEISATWIAPRVISKIGAVRSGMWFLSFQMFWLGATVAFFWSEKSPIIAASGLSGGTIISRIGLWGYDLSAQVIIQTEVQGDHRGSFSTTEQGFQNAAELLSYLLTIILYRPSQFRYPVLVSAIAVYTAGLLYGVFLRRRRGHLVHAPTCFKS